MIERPGEEASEEAMAAAAAAAATKAANAGNKARSRAGSIAPGNKSKKKKKGGGGAGVPEIRRVAAQSLAKPAIPVYLYLRARAFQHELRRSHEKCYSHITTYVPLHCRITDTNDHSADKNGRLPSPTQSELEGDGDTAEEEEEDGEEGGGGGGGGGGAADSDKEEGGANSSSEGEEGEAAAAAASTAAKGGKKQLSFSKDVDRLKTAEAEEGGGGGGAGDEADQVSAKLRACHDCHLNKSLSWLH